MEQQGRITQWNDARGFGFITPLSGGSNVFVHISQIQPRNRRPRLNDLVFYLVGCDERGRSRAKQVRYHNHRERQSVKTKSLSSVFVLLAAFLGLLGLSSIYSGIISVGPNPSLTRSTSADDKAIANAFQAQESRLQMRGEGVVDRILSDDNDGSRHQRFILRLASGQTLLIAHNIDIAPRLEPLSSGDRVAFYGQYEWSPEGGVIHWTHRDPDGEHISGWLKHNDQMYQ